MDAATLITSSRISILTGVPMTSIIHYANIGVLNPQKDSNGRRLFSHEDVEKLIAHREAKAAKAAARKKRPATEQPQAA
jgi:DNA-binding transcriptional MerR regulator